MKGRCLNPKNTNFKNYGGRGIKICPRWMKFENFMKDMLPTWKKGLTLERLNNNGDYKLSNCSWVTNFEQQNNKRNNRKYKGMTASQWSRELGGRATIVLGRLYNGWSWERAVTTKVRRV